MSGLFLLARLCRAILYCGKDGARGDGGTGDGVDASGAVGSDVSLGSLSLLPLAIDARVPGHARVACCGFGAGDTAIGETDGVADAAHNGGIVRRETTLPAAYRPGMGLPN